MPPGLDLQHLALEMKAAQDSARQIGAFTARLPAFDLCSGYEVADRIHHLRLAEGAKPVGRKILHKPDMWFKFGVREPIWAHVYDTTVVQLHETRTTCRISRFVEPKIEPEIVFQFHSAPQAGAGLIGVVKAISWVAHGFEIVQSHFPGWRFQAPDTVADWALHGTLLIGPPQPLPRLSDIISALSPRSPVMRWSTRRNRKGSNVLGGPLTAIAHLLSVLAKQPECAPPSWRDRDDWTVTTAVMRAGETGDRSAGHRTSWPHRRFAA
jgi:2-oxo-3-hexenedioate decarboxylase